MELDPEFFSFVLHHVFLPPKLPHKADDNLQCPKYNPEYKLLELVQQVLKGFISQSTPDCREKWSTAANMLDSWIQLGIRNEAQSFDATLANLKSTGALACYVKEQNCGLVVSYDHKAKNILVDAFEASAQNEAMFTCPGGLLRHFPGISIVLPADKLDDPHFRSFLSSSVFRLTSEKVREMVPKAQKAGTEPSEHRDTTHPGLVTECLMAQLLALGSPNQQHRFTKHVRDEVNWKSGMPWRRSAVWLVFRVALQTVLQRSFPRQDARIQYKNFILYLMAKISKHTAPCSKPADVVDRLALVRAKIGRRMYKIKETIIVFVDRAVDHATRGLLARLLEIQEQMQSQKMVVRPLPFQASMEDCKMSLTHCKEYLHEAMNHHPNALQHPKIEREKKKHLRMAESGLPLLETRGLQELCEFEQWVADELPTWVERLEPSKYAESCGDVAKALKNYLHYATPVFQSDPRALSLMILIALELWMVIDKLAVQICPLLKKFSPEIPHEFLQPLLLPKLSQMARAAEIEEHLRSRHSDQVNEYPSIFSDPRARSFAVQFFQSSPHHQELQEEILAYARGCRDAKSQELQSLRREYQRIMSKAAKIGHRYFTGYHGKPIHSYWCQACDIEKEAAQLRVQVYEWPLPENEIGRGVAVFELDPPEWFVTWRDSTWMVVHDMVKRAPNTPEDDVYTWPLYDGIVSFVRGKPKHRLTLASTTRPWGVSHYKEVDLSTDLGDVCKPNALFLQMFDQRQSGWATINTPPMIKSLCTLQLPEGPYSDLQYAVDSTRHGQNSVIANQFNYHQMLNLDTVRAFGSLRAGEGTQWLNLLRELESPALPFNEPSVLYLVEQSIWELGSPASEDSEPAYRVQRLSHSMVGTLEFDRRILEVLRKSLTGIEENWNQWCQLRLLVALGVRVIALCHESIASDAVCFLRRCREVALEWCNKLNQRLSDGTANGIEKDQYLILHIAGSSLATYDVDRCHLDTVLCNDQDVESFTRPLIILFENSISSPSSLSEDIKDLLRSSQRIACLSRERLWAVVQRIPSGLNKAIQDCTTGIQVSKPWKIDTTACEWLVTQGKAPGQKKQQEIYFSLVTGQLLIDGRTPGCLPGQYMKSTIYRRLFKSVTLYTTPSSLPGMAYVARKTMEDGSEVHFGMINDRIVIKARRGSRILQLVPHKLLENDFPEDFVTEYVHWLDLETGTLEFRPLNEPWSSSEENWRLEFTSPSRETMVMRQGDKLMVDMHNNRFSSISHYLSPLDSPGNITILQASEGVTEVELPRLRLRFFIDRQGSIQSKDFNASVHLDQDIGCLYGLKNKLVLRHNTTNQLSVLIPYGRLVITREAEHVQVTVQHTDQKRRRCFQYILNEHLKILRGPQDLLADLYLGYLHAVTAMPLPDRLTGRTGTEEALRILSRESLQSPFPPDQNCVHMLGRICALSPSRKYYPKHIKVMQTVVWDDVLGQVAQHPDFTVLAHNILQFSNRFVPFHDSSSPGRIPVRFANLGLLNRARVHETKFRCSDFSPLPLNCSESELYKARDCDLQSPRARRVYEVAALIRDWPSEVNHVQGFLDTIKGYDSISFLRPPTSHFTCKEAFGMSVKDSWTSLYGLCSSSSRHEDSYPLLDLFGAIAFHGEIDQSIIRQLLLLSFSGCCRDLPLPCDECETFEVTRGEHFCRSTIERVIENQYQLPPPRTYTHMSPHQMEVERQRKEESDNLKDRVVSRCCDELQQQWPCTKPTLPPQHEIVHVNRGEAIADCGFNFTLWVRNGKFFNFLREMEQRLAAFQTPYCMHEDMPDYQPGVSSLDEDSSQPPGLLDLVRQSQPMFFPGIPTLSIPSHHFASLKPSSELRALARNFRRSQLSHHQDYGNELKRSIKAMRSMSSHAGFNPLTEDSLLHVSRETIVEHRIHLQSQLDALCEHIVRILKITGGLEATASQTVCPSITVYSVLSVLSSSAWDTLPLLSRRLIVTFAQLISYLRRCDRLMVFESSKNIDEFRRELQNPGYEGWDPLDYPMWLLLEIENDIMIRKTQAQVAIRTITGDSTQNAVLQLNMGEGKTSVITPMVASVLANGRHLARIIVLKPLLRQTVDLLSQRLGGLIGRRIYHVPFSRKASVNSTMIEQLRSTWKDCLKNHGILITLPEHILSFRLVGVEAATRYPDHFQELIRLEDWLQRHCRDVIDESDEVLDTKFQLVYTMGTQQPLDGKADRWEVVQDVLRLAAVAADKIRGWDCRSIGLDKTLHRYPILRFFKAEAIEKLIERLLVVIPKNGLSGVPFLQWNSHLRESALRFIGRLEVSGEDVTLIRDSFEGGVFFTKLLVLRGLLAHGILKFALAGKRWLVDYGLHRSRCLMAVPYRAKGVPSENSEFGHPDVAIILTCLSYYYEGLTKGELGECFSLLLTEHDPATEYKNWISACKRPLKEGLQSLSGVNLEDHETFEEELFPALRDQTRIVNYYLSRHVFPREAKEFPSKLSTSAWDIPAQPGRPITTGFSGTNDNQFLLPQSIRQRDLEHLAHTNAMVLETLLQERNQQCILAEDAEGCQLKVTGLLNLVRKRHCKGVHVLIDVGAQILEWGNYKVAQHWLSITAKKNIEAAIYFSEADEAMVINREGHVESLASSSFRQRMESCLVFLDQHHSRGVDLKLPPYTRAAVTLGPRLTKDRLVQACNRLRGLSKGQSVLFLIPPEVKHSMEELLGDSATTFTSRDVLHWTLHQTSRTLDSLRPLWADHGLRHHRRLKGWGLLFRDQNPSAELAVEMQEPEARALCQLYTPWAKQGTTLFSPGPFELSPQEPLVQQLIETFSSSGGQANVSYLYEEQEREIAREVEREEQVSRPQSSRPLPHRVSDGLGQFVKRGRFSGDQIPQSLTPAFCSLGQTSVAHTPHPVFPDYPLYVTGDFMHSVMINDGCLADDFMKSVHWILSSVHDDTMIIMSQHEVNSLLLDIQRSKHARLYVYAPRTTKPMRSFCDFEFCTVGAHSNKKPSERMVRLLELFAGSLYFEKFGQYQDFRSFLGLVSDSADIPEGSMSNEGFVHPSFRQQLQWPIECPFTQTPLPFLKALVHMRTDGDGYKRSHVGTVIEMMLLAEDRF